MPSPSPGSGTASGSSSAPIRRGVVGAFITFEGIDGCGKSTQIELLAARLRERGHPLCTTREPGGTAIGQELRAVLLNPAHTHLTANAELLLYLADRTQHLAELIRPALQRGETVLCDRYHDATVAYQQHGRGLDFAKVLPYIQAEIASTPPQLTFWIDVPVERAAERMAARRIGGTAPRQAGEPALHSGAASGGGGDESRLDRESAAFHGRVRSGYDAIWRAEPGRVCRIDGSAGIETVQAAIWVEMEARFDDL